MGLKRTFLADCGPPERSDVERPVPLDHVFSPAALHQIDELRLRLLDGLPVAVAVIGRGPDGIRVQVANALFTALASCGEQNDGGEPEVATHPILASFQSEILHFLAGADRVRDVAWQGGGRLARRHYLVRLAMLSPASESEDRLLLSLIDRTGEVDTARSLRSEMLHDSLTGLPNMVAFGEAVEAALAEGAPFAVLMLDLRRFSRINESLGSVAGDEFIITVARRLKSNLRAGDLLARTGGDEFGVVLRIGDELDALEGARRLRQSFDHPIRLSELEIRSECAVGIAVAGRSGRNAEELIRNAQFAAKQAKGSCGLEVYHADEARRARRRFALETELRRAVEGNLLELAFQPVIELATGTVTGFEALARWKHPVLGCVPPTEFIPVAEESGLIVPLGRWVLDAAASTLARWDRAAGALLPISMAVNISSVQMRQDDVPTAVAEVLTRHGLDGRRLTLELTESIVIADPTGATATLRALKALAVRIALDDFGTGYSSFAYLQRLPIDILKIDRSFVTEMLGDRDSVAIVRAVLGLADALGMSTTAEGVETRELAQTLGALGCHHAQGFHFGRPLPADAAYALLVPPER